MKITNLKNILFKSTRLILASTLTSAALVWSSASFAGGTEYDLRVDGLACPFCAYGIEKKFTKTKGVESVEVDLKNGLVIVKTDESKTFKEEELKTIVHDAGFTMKSMTEKAR
ncbi:MAG TPA: heavy-metal-associated domain-containing protein [Gammaproteobacteria bacterium]|nr:heavy-metal-associated domain-containing protein [Gammaproteobacteria bacterium]